MWNKLFNTFKVISLFCLNICLHNDTLLNQWAFHITSCETLYHYCVLKNYSDLQWVLSAGHSGDGAGWSHTQQLTWHSPTPQQLKASSAPNQYENQNSDPRGFQNVPNEKCLLRWSLLYLTTIPLMYLFTSLKKVFNVYQNLDNTFINQYQIFTSYFSSVQFQFRLSTHLTYQIPNVLHLLFFSMEAKQSVDMLLSIASL